jgi:predicted transcriptional regulator
MKKHRGMRSQDIVVLLKIAALREQEWFVKDVALALGISQSEVSESLNRSRIAGLLSEDKKRLMSNNLLDFLEHGLRYVFPAEPGAIQRGMLTAHSAPPLNQHISAEDAYVWPWAEGNTRGQAIEPLHREVPGACVRDPLLYELIALADAIRLGRVREKQLAVEELRKRIVSL